MKWTAIDNALSDPSFFIDHDPHPLWQQLAATIRSTGQKDWVGRFVDHSPDDITAV